METPKKNHLSETIKDNGEYNGFLTTEEWKIKRRIIMYRDGNRCRNCGNQTELQVHHKQYHKNRKNGEFRKPWQYDDRYLITLCQPCHKSGHQGYTIPIFNI